MRVTSKVTCLHTVVGKPISRRHVTERQIVASRNGHQVGHEVIAHARGDLRTKATERGHGHCCEVSAARTSRNRYAIGSISHTSHGVLMVTKARPSILARKARLVSHRRLVLTFRVVGISGVRRAT